MGTIVTTEVQDGQIISASTTNNNFRSIKDVVNGGIDDSNIAVNAGIQLSKLAAGPATVYNPVWTAHGTPGSIGDGILSGTYVQMGKIILATVFFRIGSTTSLGSGYWDFSTPIAGSNVRTYHGQGGAVKEPQHYQSPLWCNYHFTSHTIVPFWLNTALGGVLDLVDETHPIVWAPGDFLEFTVTYEAA